jgi:hypothetical protein
MNTKLDNSCKADRGTRHDVITTHSNCVLIKPRHVLVVLHESSARALCDILFFIKLFQNTD